MDSLEQVVASDEETGGEIFLFHDVLSRDEEDPSTKAARKLDWETFIAGLPKRDRLMIEFLIEGKTGSAMARKLKVSDSIIRTSKKDLALKILEFMGFDILVQIQRRPNWKQDLEGIRERMACKHERSH